MNRRTFIKTSGIAGSAALIPQLLSSKEKTAEIKTVAPDDLLRGVCDIHIHRETAEDVRDLSKKAHALGYRAIMLKPTYWPCDELASIATEDLPDFKCFNGLIMTK